MARRLIFDVDASQFLADGETCFLCQCHQQITESPRSFVRVRESIPGGSIRVAWFCPNCVARLFLQMERLGLWSQVSGQIIAALRRMFMRRHGGQQAEESKRIAPRAIGPVLPTALPAPATPNGEGGEP